MTYYQDDRATQRGAPGGSALGRAALRALTPLIVAAAMFGAVVALPLALGFEPPTAPAVEDWRGNSAALPAR